MDFNIKNANYERVLKVLNTLRRDRDRSQNVCGCPKCLGAIIVHALNSLSPHYYIEDRETGVSRELGSPWVMVEVAVAEALENVPHSNHS